MTDTTYQQLDVKIDTLIRSVAVLETELKSVNAHLARQNGRVFKNQDDIRTCQLKLQRLEDGMEETQDRFTFTRTERSKTKFMFIGAGISVVTGLAVYVITLLISHAYQTAS